MNKSKLVKIIFTATIFLYASVSSAQSQIMRTQKNAETMISYQDGKKNYDMKFVNDKLMELSINGKKIPPEEFPKYQEQVNKIRTETKKDEENAYRDRLRAEKQEAEAEAIKAEAMAKADEALEQ